MSYQLIDEMEGSVELNPDMVLCCVALRCVAFIFLFSFFPGLHSCPILFYFILPILRYAANFPSVNSVFVD